MLEETAMTALIRMMTNHPGSVNESYFEHMRFAGGFGFALLGAAGAAFVHALLPFCFVKTASGKIAALYQRTGNRGS